MSEEIVANGKWVLEGTAKQNAILLPVFERGSQSYVAFPWERIGALPKFPVPIGWADLNTGKFGAHEAEREVIVADAGERRPVNPHLVCGEDEGHAILRPSERFGEAKGRFMTAGVFWTDGRVNIDIRLEADAATAREVLSAEMAHAVDYGLPLSEAQRSAIMRLFHGAGADAHTWWERDNYDAEYYTLVGESWMALFTHAYSNIEPWQATFTHKSLPTMAAEVYRILGIWPVGTKPPVFEVRARTRQTRYGNAYAELTWSGLEGSRVSVWRDGVRLMRTLNDGHFVNFLGRRRGTFSYVLVGEEGQRSNEATLSI